MNNFRKIQTDLKTEWSRLQRHWQTIGSLWNDSARLRFEKDIWQEYEHILPLMCDEIENLALIIEKAKQEVK